VFENVSTLAAGGACDEFPLPVEQIASELHHQSAARPSLASLITDEFLAQDGAKIFLKQCALDPVLEELQRRKAVASDQCLHGVRQLRVTGHAHPILVVPRPQARPRQPPPRTRTCIRSSQTKATAMPPPS
jgi:hypothetical protein